MTDQRQAGHLLNLHRAPLKVAGICLAAWLLLWNTSRTTFTTDAGKHPWLDWVVVAYIAYSAVFVLLVIPRHLAPRALQRATDSERVPLVVASIRLAGAAAPALVGFALVGAGADQWAGTAAVIVSALLLIPYVRAAPSTQAPS